MNEIIDLWPKDIETQRVAAPVTVLRQQAALLGQKTRNLVTADIVEASSYPKYSKDNFNYQFLLVAPVLGDYRYLLLTIFHDISLYPLTVSVEESILNEIGDDFEKEVGGYNEVYIIAKTEDQFLNVLRRIFGSRKSHQVITSLLSQSDPDWGEANLGKPPAQEEDDIPF